MHENGKMNHSHKYSTQERKSDTKELPTLVSLYIEIDLLRGINDYTEHCGF